MNSAIRDAVLCSAPSFTVSKDCVHPALQRFPKLSKTGLSLLNGLLTYDPDRRTTARQALKHPYFRELPLAMLPHNMPYFPSAHDADANDDQHKRYLAAARSCM